MWSLLERNNMSKYQWHQIYFGNFEKSSEITASSLSTSRYPFMYQSSTNFAIHYGLGDKLLLHECFIF